MTDEIVVVKSPAMGPTDLLEARLGQLERDAKVIVLAAEEKMIEHLSAAAHALNEAPLPAGKHMVVVPGGEILDIEVKSEITKTGGRRSGERNWVNLQPRYGRGRR